MGMTGAERQRNLQRRRKQAEIDFEQLKASFELHLARLQSIRNDIDEHASKTNDIHLHQLADQLMSTVYVLIHARHGLSVSEEEARKLA